MDQRHPAGGGAKRDVIDEQMVADEESVFHRSAGDYEILTEKLEREQANDEDRAQTGEGLERSLFSRFCRCGSMIFSRWCAGYFPGHSLLR